MRTVGIYIGGAQRGCAQPNLTASWARTVSGLGWRFLPIYVGLQAPCSTNFDASERFTAANAAASGAAAAQDAITQMTSLGFAAGSPVYVDLENYDSSNAACARAVKSFVSAWDSTLQAANFVAAVYGSSSSLMVNLLSWISDSSFAVPQAVWYAHWDGKNATTGDSYLPDWAWVNHQRVHQYQTGSATYGGKTLSIDYNALDGPVAPPSAVVPTQVPGSYVPLTPYRILDTRIGQGGTVVAPGATLQVNVAGTGGPTGVPASGVAAVAVNLTVTQSTQAGTLTVYSGPGNVPSTSNLNYVAGQTVANMTIAQLSSTGTIRILNRSGGSTQIIADVSGYYLAGSSADAGTFQPVTPTRLLDTRDGTGVAAGAVGQSRGVNVAVAGLRSVPAGATAIFDVVVTNPQASGVVTVYPGPADPTNARAPQVSNLNYVAGQTVANLVVTRLGPDGTVNFGHVVGTGTVDLVADLQGYFLPGSGASTGTFVPVSPFRLFDTRATSPLTSLESRTVQAAGVGGLPASGVGAVAMNATVTDPQAAGVLTIYPAGQSIPSSSVLNYLANQTVPNLTFTTLGNGALSVLNRSAGTAQYVGDIFGYFRS